MNLYLMAHLHQNEPVEMAPIGLGMIDTLECVCNRIKINGVAYLKQDAVARRNRCRPTTQHYSVSQKIPPHVL